jgi:DNA modification methylase
MEHEKPSQADAGMNHVGNRLEVVTRPIAELILDPKNPRLHGRRQIRKIARSIQAYGFCVPVLLHRQDHVLAGHGRILACQALGWREVPTINLAHLSPTQARAFMIADNRLTDMSIWDEQLLGQQLKELAEVHLEFRLDATGFEVGEIDLLIEGISPAPLEGADDPGDRLPDLPATRPVSQLGDLWLLDRHRLWCGNALEEDTYPTLMAHRQAAMVFTDPPYNVPIAGHASGLGQVVHQNFAMASGELSEAEFLTFLTQTCRLLAQASVDGALIYVCMDWRHLGELLAAGRAAALVLKNLCVWDKETGGMGSFYRSQHELVLVWKSGTLPHQNNIQLGQYGRNRTNVWRYPGIHSFAGGKDEGNLLALHPTVKPVALVADALLDASQRGDVILDAFLGSGTTLIAAERTGRICYGVELDPRYVDTAIRRWQTWTGQQARHARSGRVFDDLAAEKGGRDVTGHVG